MSVFEERAWEGIEEIMHIYSQSLNQLKNKLISCKF